MNNRFSFRAWHNTHKEMIPNNRQGFEGDVFNWLNQGQDIEIMQGTGLLDVNKIQIYDCDIVKIWHEDYPDEKSIGKVIWNNGGEYPAFDVYIPNYMHAFGWDAYSDEYNSFSCPENCIEVIGNIYKNPELIGES